MNRLALALFAATAFSAAALAQVKMDGNFTAAKACDAVVSIKKGTNPDNAAVESGKSYHLLGKNKDDATHYWIEVPNAQPKQRWVAVDCGSTDGSAASSASAQAEQCRSQHAARHGEAQTAIARLWRTSALLCFCFVMGAHLL